MVNDEGKLKGFYEVVDPGCIIRKVEYAAGGDRGFQVLDISRRSCEESEVPPQVDSAEDVSTEEWDSSLYGYRVVTDSEETVGVLLPGDKDQEEDLYHSRVRLTKSPKINFLGDGKRF